MLRTIISIIGAIFAIAILLYFFFVRDASVRPRTKDETPLNIDLQAIKPEAWKAVTKDGLKKINIDGDEDIEWLFLYRNTQDTNQIGGVIYDAQSEPRGVTSLPLSQQVSAYLVPYRLLPDYVNNKSIGYIADDNVRYHVFSSLSKESDKEEDKTTDISAGRFLAMSGLKRGAPNRLSLFWWINKQEGYGGALATTPGWFSLSKDNPNVWPKWAGGSAENVDPLTEIYAWEPQMDRSNICQRVKWKLEGTPEQNDLHFVGEYDKRDLVFCRGGAPKEPAFPEAQVLAYLLDNNAERRKGRLHPNAQETFLDNVSLNNVIVRQISEPVITVDTTMTDVFVEFDVDENTTYRTVWRVEMIPPQNLKSTVHWRIVAVYTD